MPVVLDRETDVQLTVDEIRGPMASITRRRIMIGGAGAVLFTAMPNAIRGQEATPVEMRQLTDKVGTVLVPEHPQRVIVEGNSTLGNMIALGMKPIAASFNHNSLPTFLADQIGDVVDAADVSAGALDIELALSLKPDLIISIWGSGGEGWNLENVERYKQGVPATYAYEQNYTYEEDIKQNLIEVARALNVEDRAQAVLEAYDRRVTDLRQKVTATGFNDKPVSIVRFMQNAIWISFGTSESIIFRAIDIPQPEGQQNPEEFGIELSLERLDILHDAYALVIYVDDNAEITQEEILSNPVWQSVAAVREGRVIFVNSGTWNSIEMPGAMAIMDDVEHLLLPLSSKA